MLEPIINSSGKNVGTKLEHLESVYRQTGKKPSDLNYPDIDPSMMHIVGYFNQIKKQEGQKITYTELQSFQSIMAVDLSPFQCEVIMKIDAIYEGVNHG